MDSIEKISKWITDQKSSGRSHDDLHGTIFVLSNTKTARISKAEDYGFFNIEILYSPYTVDFTKEELN